MHARRTALRLRHRASTRALGPLRHLLDERFSTFEQRLTSQSAPAPQLTPAGWPTLQQALRRAEIARMPDDDVATLISVGTGAPGDIEEIANRYGGLAHHVVVAADGPAPAPLPREVTWLEGTVHSIATVEDQTVDLVFGGRSVERCTAEDLVTLLCEAHRVLRPGRHLVIDGVHRLAATRYRWTHRDHTIELTPSEAAELVTLAGFDVRTVRGMWRCVSPTGQTLPFSASGPEEEVARIQSAVDAPDDALLWWLEAERAVRPADPDALTRRAQQIHADAWPETASRLGHEVGTREERDGETWVAVAAGTHGFAMRGPSTGLVPGDWTVTFLAEVDPEEEAEAFVCRVAVTADGGGVVLTEATRTAGEIRMEPAITLTFTAGAGVIPDAEFVVEALGGPAFRTRLGVTTNRRPSAETQTGPPEPATFSEPEAMRIALTTSATDTDRIPKVPGAGEVGVHRGVPFQLMHNGVRVEAGGYYGRWMTEVIHRLRGHHEPQEEWAFHQLVTRLQRDTPAPVTIELGSFWAYYSLWVKHAIPATRCLLVEPDPTHLEVGRRNFALNDVEAEILNAAAGLPHGTSADITCESDGIVRSLPLVSVDGLRDQFSLPRVDLLLCDTQGAEVAALQGCEQTIADGALRFAVISTHHHSITGDPLTHQRCLEVLAGYDAHILVEHTVHESSSGDGLIVASMDARDAGATIEVSRTRAADSLFGPLEPELAAALSELDRLRNAPATTTGSP